MNSRYLEGWKPFHDGKKKINQIPICINSYSKFLAELGVTHLQPVRYVRKGIEIEKIIGKRWAENGNQLQCVFSGNYNRANGEVMINESKVREYLIAFLIPMTRIYIKGRLTGNSSNEKEIENFAKNLFKKSNHV